MSLPAFAAPSSHWAAPIYEKWVQAGVISDTEDFERIDAAVTRAELVHILDEVLNWSWDTMAKDTFRDLVYLEDGSTYWSDMDFIPTFSRQWERVLSAVPPSITFSPFQPVTRQARWRHPPVQAFQAS